MPCQAAVSTDPTEDLDDLNAHIDAGIDFAAEYW